MAETKRSANPSTVPRRRRAATAKPQVAAPASAGLAPTEQPLADMATLDAGVASEVINNEFQERALFK